MAAMSSRAVIKVEIFFLSIYSLRIVALDGLSIRFELFP
jgi:hypothetical protein